MEDYGSQHFIRTNQLVITVVDDEIKESLVVSEDIDEQNGETQNTMDSKSEEDENKNDQ